MKKLVPIGFSLLLALSLAACTGTGEPVPGSSAAESAAPESTAPESSAPESSAPESAAPESSAPGSSAPESAAQTVIGGIITAEDTDTLTLEAPDGTSYVFSTEGADKTTGGGLDVGSAVWVYYNSDDSGDLPKEGITGKAERLMQAEAKTATGTMNEGSSMDTLLLDTDQGQMEFPFGGGAADGVKVGKKITVTYAENPDAPKGDQIVTLSIGLAD